MLHTRLRPHCKEFLEKIAELYELHVFTFGSRLYAHTIAGNSIIDIFFFLCAPLVLAACVHKGEVSAQGFLSAQDRFKSTSVSNICQQQGSFLTYLPLIQI